MRRITQTFLLAAATLVASGCGGGAEPITDPSKLPPVTEEQKKAIRAADDQIAAEENANPTNPTRPGQQKAAR